MRARVAFLVVCLLGFGAQPAAAAVPACPYPATIEIGDESVDVTDLRQACESVEAADLVVGSGALLGLQASEDVTLKYGTRVDGQSAIQVNVASPELSDISLSDSSVVALDKVYVGNLPAVLESVTAESMALEVKYEQIPSAPGIAVREDDAGVYFHAPFNFEDPTVAGNVSIFVAAGNSRSPAFTLNVSPLPDSPGAMDALLLTLQSQLQSAATLLGSDLQSIRQATPQSVLQMPRLLPLKYAEAILDDGGRPTSLLGVTAVASGFLNAKERQFLDQIAGYSRLDDLAQLYTDVWADEFASSGVLGGAVAAAVSPPRLKSLAGPAQRSATVSPRSLVGCIDNPLPAELTPAQLSKYMTLATESAIRSSAAGATYLNFAAAAAGGSGALFAAAGVISAPVAAGAAAVLGGAFATHLAMNGAVAGIFPSQFTDLTVDLTRSRFNLDYEDPGFYSRLMATAASTGWIADGAAFDFLTSAAGFKAVNTAAVAKDSFNILEGALDSSVIASVSSLSALQTEGLLEVCPAQWQVDLSDAEWSTVIALSGIFSVAPQEKKFEPREASSDTLRFFPKPPKFGFQQISINRAVGVDDMLVTATPGQIEVEPGDDVPISAKVEFADDTRLSWNASLGAWQDGSSESDSAETVTKTLQTPADRSAYPFDVTVTSLSNRKLTSPTAIVDAKVTIRAETLSVVPGYACLDSGQSKSFQALNDDNEPVDVNWSLEGAGSVSASGLGSASYSAPAIGTGSALSAFVTATARDSPSLSATVQVDVGACTCEWNALVNGTTINGDYSSHEFEPVFPPPLDFQRGSGDRSAALFGVPLSPGQTGTLAPDGMGLQISLSPTLACTALNDASQPESPLRVTLDLIENDGRIVRGRLTGVCSVQPIFDPQNATLSSFVISFRSNNRAILRSGGFICNAPP